MTLRPLFNMAALIGAMLCAPDLAAEPQTLEPINFKGLYEFDLAGVPIGKLGIDVAQSRRHYVMTSDAMTTGLVKLFVKHLSHTMVEASGTTDFVYPTAEYESHYQTRNKKKYVKMSTRNGVTGEELLVPPDNPASRPPVPPELKKNVADPLTLLLRMREELWKAEQDHTDHFSIPLYDGRRLTSVDFVVVKKQTLRYQGNVVPVILVTVTRQFVAGFSQQELSDRDPHEPELRLYFSDDARLVPLRAEFTTLFGTASAVLTSECPDSCLFGVSP